MDVGSDHLLCNPYENPLRDPKLELPLWDPTDHVLNRKPICRSPLRSLTEDPKRDPNYGCSKPTLPRSLNPNLAAPMTIFLNPKP